MSCAHSRRSALRWRREPRCQPRSACSPAFRWSDAHHVLSRLAARRCLEGITERTGDIMTGRRTHVVVIGGGYAGTIAANHLRMRNDVDITLVNPRPQFIDGIALV